MFLQKLEIQGFKSFAEKTTFIFPARQGDKCGITAVIGPNGSGKSNVADAARWVLGEQSLKLLRSKRAEDVIFFGSGAKAQKGFCEASLFFNNEDHSIPLDFAEVVITRRLFRDGTSEYILNKNKVRLSDITLLLAQAHMGQRNYSVIGQGMIDTILQTPPSERKEFFDEAVGVKEYQIKKDSALGKLKSTNENLSTAQLVLQELEPKMKFFTRQLKRLEEREEIEKELRGYLVAYYTTLWNDLSTRKDGFEKERVVLQNTVDRLSQDKEARTAVFSAEERKARSDDGGSFQGLQQTLSKMQNELQHLLTRLSVLEGRLQTELIKTGQGQLAWLSQKNDELRTNMKRIVDEIATLEKDIAMLIEQEQEQERGVQGERGKAQASAVQPSDDKAGFAHIASLIDAALDLHAEGAHSDTPIQRIREILGYLKDQLSIIKIYLVDQMKGHASKSEQDAAIKQYTLLADELRVTQTRKDILTERLRLRTEERQRITTEVDNAAREIEYFTASDRSEQQRAILLEKEELVGRRDILEKEIGSVQHDLDLLYDTEKEKGRHLLELQKEITALGKEQEGYQQFLTKARLEIAKIEAHQEELLQKIFDDLRVAEPTRQEIIQKSETLASVLGFSEHPDPVNMEETRITIDRLKRKVEQIGSIDEGLVSEHEETKQRYEFLTGQVTDLVAAQESLHTAIEELNSIIQDRFEKNLESISTKFTHYFQQLFAGGTARIIIQREAKKEEDGTQEDDEVLESPRDAISGIEIEATPPGKKFKSLSFLSGGEKTLTAIALLCAILAQNPSPFVILDEVDAALDESNANRFAEIIKDLSSQTQFILITHNRVTMHIGHVLYGVTMGPDGISHTLSLDIGSLDGIVGK